MRRGKRLVSVSTLTATLIMVLGLSFGSVVFAQEARWEALNKNALLLFQQGKFSEGVKVAKEALSVAEETLGPDNPEVAVSLSNLAVLYEKQGLYHEAEYLQRRALAILEKALRPDHPDVAQSLYSLGALYDVMGKEDEAGRFLKRAARIRAKQ
ncbi:MAG: tetratricopeptide repeat protein [bacterium]|nr:tetratricopeptide repeat protein [bacterium]